MKGGKSDAANVERMPYQTAINVSNFFIDCFFDRVEGAYLRARVEIEGG